VVDRDDGDFIEPGVEVFRCGPIGKGLAVSLGLAACLALGAYLESSTDTVATVLFGLFSLLFVAASVGVIFQKFVARVEVYPDRIVIRQLFKRPVSIHNDLLKMIETLTSRQNDRTFQRLVLEDGRSFLLSPYERLYRLRKVLLDRIGDSQLAAEPRLVGPPRREPFSQWLLELIGDSAKVRKGEQDQAPTAEPSRVELEPHSEREENRNG